MSSTERAFNRKSISFKRWFDSTLNKEEILIEGLPIKAVIQDQNQNNNKDLSDDKYLILENGVDVNVGNYVDWRNRVWMVFSEEEKTIQTHQQLKMKPSNHVIKWMINGSISGGGKGYPAFIQNQTLYTLGVSTSGNHAWLVNAKMMMYLPNNSETVKINIGQRVVIGTSVYQVMFRDPVSRKGLINYLLEQDVVSNDRDNIELGVADYYGSPKDDIESSSPNEPVAGEFTLSSVDALKIGTSITIKANSPVVEWIVNDTDKVSQIVSQDDSELVFSMAKDFRNVGSVVSVIAKDATGRVASKTVNVISPY